MPLVPWTDLDLQTPLPPAAVAARLAAAVEPRRALRFGPGRLPFEGEVAGDTFRIRRVIAYQNGWRPELHGALTPAPGGGGTRVYVRLRLSWPVAAFSAVWLAFAVLLALPGTSELWAGGHVAPSTLLPWAFLVAGYAFMTGAFSFEAWRSRAALAAVLRAGDAAAGGSVGTGAPAA